MFALEKRGYVKAGPWTPEATVEYPEAGRITSSSVLAQRWWSVRSRVKLFLKVHFLNFLLGLSASAAQGVPEGGLRCHADVHFLRQR